MRGVAIVVLVPAVAFAAGAEPRVTRELGEKVRAGIGKLTEDDVLRLVPGPVKVVAGPEAGEADRVLRWEEATSVEVVLIGGKVVSATADFNDTVVSKTLTLARFRQVKAGMTQAELEKVLGGPTSSESNYKDDAGQPVTTWRWSQGRRVFASIKDGKVTGGGFIEGSLP
jgi:hypothetical protein